MSDPNGVKIPLAAGGFVTVSPATGNAGVQLGTGTPGYLPGTGLSVASVTEASAILTALTAVIANVTPAVTAATISGANFVVTGTALSTASPGHSTVTFAQGTGGTAPSPATWTQYQVLAAGGSFSGTSVSIPTSAFSTVPVSGNTVVVNANGNNSNTFVSDETPHLTLAHTVSTNFVITGTNLLDLANLTTVTFAAGTSTIPSPATFTQAAITGGGGSVTATTITIPNALFTVTAPTAGNTVHVTANSLTSNTLTTT